jgi:transcriptional regulator with XRE-family HTH domain
MNSLLMSNASIVIVRRASAGRKRIHSMALELWTPGPPAKTFSARIRQLRGGRSQREVAEQVAGRLKENDGGHFSVTYLCKIERKKHVPKDSVIVAIADVLEVDSDELLALAGRPPIDLEEKLARSPAAREFFKHTIDVLDEEEWCRLLAEMQKKKEDEKIQLELELDSILRKFSQDQEK